MMLTRLLAAERRRVLATPLTWWLLSGTAGIGVVGTLTPLLVRAGEPVDLLSDRSLQEAMHGAAAGAVLVIIAGIIGTAGEWRYGQASQTFLTTPRRWRVLAAKAVTFGVVGAAYGVAAGIASLATAWGWYAAHDTALPVGRSAVWLTLLGCVAVAGLFGVLGVAIGAVTRNLVAGIIPTLAWLVIVEPALFAAAPSVFRWLPGIASLSLRRQPAEDLLPPAVAAAVLVAVVAAVLAAGARLVERDDVTG